MSANGSWLVDLHDAIADTVRALDLEAADCLTTHLDHLERLHHASKMLPHQAVLERAWEPEGVADPSYLKVFVRPLRLKRGDDAEARRDIPTEWGTGYRFIAR
ncbi:MAG: winged helix-turn-helix domain-containing protein [Chloroflexota bacterium]|nr:winged helix-turn-helix domain-containing protein [Chloroflexota bacterium]